MCSNKQGTRKELFFQFEPDNVKYTWFYHHPGIVMGSFCCSYQSLHFILIFCFNGVNSDCEIVYSSIHIEILHQITLK